MLFHHPIAGVGKFPQARLGKQLPSDSAVLAADRSWPQNRPLAFEAPISVFVSREKPVGFAHEANSAGFPNDQRVIAYSSDRRAGPNS